MYFWTKLRQDVRCSMGSQVSSAAWKPFQRTLNSDLLPWTRRRPTIFSTSYSGSTVPCESLAIDCLPEPSLAGSSARRRPPRLGSSFISLCSRRARSRSLSAFIRPIKVFCKRPPPPSALESASAAPPAPTLSAIVHPCILGNTVTRRAVGISTCSSSLSAFSACIAFQIPRTV